MPKFDLAAVQSVIPTPRTDAGAPFVIGETLTVFEAAMVYAGRHPHGAFLKDASIEVHEKFLRGRSDDRTRENRRRLRSWDIYCEIRTRVRSGRIVPVKPAYDLSGEIDARYTRVRTSDLLGLAVERREMPKYLKPLVPGVPLPRPAGRPSMMPQIEAEMRRRATSGQMESSWSKEASALHSWANQNAVPPDKAPTAQTIRNSKTKRNKLSVVYREIKEQFGVPKGRMKK